MPIGTYTRNHVKNTVDSMPIGTKFTVLDILDTFKTKHGPTRIECAMCLLQLDNVVHLRKNRYNKENVWVRVGDDHE